MKVNNKLQAALEEVVADFDITEDYLKDATNKFLKEMDAGLKDNVADRLKMPMIPSFVEIIPTGEEKGLYLACDLGGTNFRVCSTLLKGDHTFDINQDKYRVPTELMSNSTGDKLFSYLAEKVATFLNEFHGDHPDPLKMGFTFSFPVAQECLDKGKLLRWTKGYNLPDVVNKDIVELFQSHLDARKIDVKIVALANDTVGTFLSASYQNEDEANGTVIVAGAIFGTGTNGAYFETFDKIKKLDHADFDAEGKGMIINTEWGSFDNDLKILPRTKYDNLLDEETENQGYHLFEKRISGMFLGELLRIILMDFHERGLLFKNPEKLTKKWNLDSKVLSYLEIDDSTELRMSALILLNALHLVTTHEERIVIQKLTQAISKRAAYLAAIALSAIVKRVKDRYKDDNRDFAIGCDGAEVEFYPGFKEKILEAVELINPCEPQSKKVHITIAKDGSGIGAGLSANSAAQSSN